MAETVLLESLMAVSQEKQMAAPTSLLWKKSETPAFEVVSGDGGMTPVTGMSSDADDDASCLLRRIWAMMMMAGCQKVL